MGDGAEVGSIGWVDLTVDDATGLRDFYSRVTGWKPENVGMGDYDDFNMNAPASGEAKAGICHARGGNAGLPAQWLIYIVVADLDQSIADCNAMGGKVIAGPKTISGMGRYCVIEDPAGAVSALFESS